MADPIVISVLKAKRAQLDGELMQTERRAIRLREELYAVDRALKVFDPDIELTAIRPVVRRAEPRFFKHGHFARAALDVLRRAEKPLTCREIAERINAEHGLNADGAHAMRSLVKKVHMAFKGDRVGVKRQRVEGSLLLSPD